LGERAYAFVQLRGHGSADRSSRSSRRDSTPSGVIERPARVSLGAGDRHGSSSTWSRQILSSSCPANLASFWGGTRSSAWISCAA